LIGVGLMQMSGCHRCATPITYRYKVAAVHLSLKRGVLPLYSSYDWPSRAPWSERNHFSCDARVGDLYYKILVKGYMLKAGRLFTNR
jgi:hypothetical protein